MVRSVTVCLFVFLLLARLMGWASIVFAGWRLSSVVVCNAAEDACCLFSNMKIFGERVVPSSVKFVLTAIVH